MGALVAALLAPPALRAVLIGSSPSKLCAPQSGDRRRVVGEADLVGDGAPAVRSELPALARSHRSAHRFVQALQPRDSKNLSVALMVTSDWPELLLLSMMLSNPSDPLRRAQ